MKNEIFNKNTFFPTLASSNIFPRLLLVSGMFSRP